MTSESKPTSELKWTGQEFVLPKAIAALEAETADEDEEYLEAVIFNDNQDAFEKEDEAARALQEEQNAQAEEADRIAEVNEAVHAEFRLRFLAQAIADERKSLAKEAYLQAYASMRAARMAKEAYEHATEEGTSSYDALQMKALDEKAKKAEETCKEAWEAAYL
jgi:hypothetical protein